MTATLAVESGLPVPMPAEKPGSRPVAHFAAPMTA
jgi:hypothetical protein